MDLSAVIFVVLALAWAGYLIPKALKHHDEMASDRLVEGHSDRVRILRRKTTVETVERREEVVAEPVPVAQPAPRATRSAARRRRRVLAVLLLGTLVVAGLAYFAVVPWWSVSVPVALVLAFLVVARLSVRKATRSSLVQRRTARTSLPAEPVVFGAAVLEDAAIDEQPVDVEVHEPDPASDVLADDGSLWDPLPMTLPTYVNKARARRTVRTIELTGMHSSGHDEEDSALARGSEAPMSDKAAEASADQEHRRVAGA